MPAPDWQATCAQCMLGHTGPCIGQWRATAHQRKHHAVQLRDAGAGQRAAPAWQVINSATSAAQPPQVFPMARRTHQPPPAGGLSTKDPTWHPSWSSCVRGRAARPARLPRRQRCGAAVCLRLARAQSGSRQLGLQLTCGDNAGKAWSGRQARRSNLLVLYPVPRPWPRDAAEPAACAQ